MRKYTFFENKQYRSSTFYATWPELLQACSSPIPPNLNAKQFNYFWFLFLGVALGFAVYNQKTISRNAESTKQYVASECDNLYSSFVKMSAGFK